MRAISIVQATPTRKLFNPFRAHGALLQGLAVPASPTRKLFSPFRAHGALLQGHQPIMVGSNQSVAALSSGSCQAMGACPVRCRYLLHSLKWPQPKNPR